MSGFKVKTNNKMCTKPLLSIIYEYNLFFEVKKYLKRIIFVTALSLVFISFFGFEAKSLSITAQPPSIDVIASPRGVRTFSVEVANTSAKTSQKMTWQGLD